MKSENNLHESGGNPNDRLPSRIDPALDEVLGTLKVMIEAGELTAEEAAELFMSGALED